MAVLVDEAAEDVTSFNVVERIARHRWPWRLEPYAPMGPSRVVVVHVGAKHSLQLAMGEDQQVNELLGSHGLDPASGRSVGSRCSHRGVNRLDTFGPED
jgi:hypothetical protein